MVQKRSDKLILIVEDSPAQALHLQGLLEKEGLRCVLASNGHTGLYLAQALMPEAVILDLVMPGKDGFQVCQELKSSKDTVNIPVILMTRYDEPKNLEHGLELGVVEFIPKDSFADAVLLETLRQMNIITTAKPPFQG